MASSDGMAARVGAHAWAQHPWGAAGSWPPRLRAAADLLLRSRSPMFLARGADLRVLYNDACAPLMRDRHPAALGEPLAEAWPDVWRAIGPLVEQVRGGEAAVVEDLLLVTGRSGRPQETYVTLACSPLDAGDPGLFCTVAETTGRVVAERRLAAVRELAAVPVEATPEEACRAAVRALDRHRADVPFVAVHLCDADGRPHLAAASGPAEGPPFPVAVDDGALADVLRTGRPAVVSGLVGHGVVGHGRRAVLPGAGAVGAAEPGTALVAPLDGPGGRPVGVVVLAASPHLPLDEGHRGFLDLVAREVGRAVAGAIAAAARRCRAEERAELDRVRQLQRATAALSGAATPPEVAAALVERLGELLGTPAVAVWQQHGDDLLEQLDLGGWTPAIRADWVSLPVDEASPAGAAAARRAPVWVETEDDWRAHYPRLLPMVRGHGYTTIDCLPLLADGRCLGVVAVGFAAERRLDGGERAAALALVDQAARALQRAGLLAAESGARTAAEEFGRVVAALSGATSPVEVGAAVLDHAAELGAAAAVVVVRAVEPGEHLRVLAATDPDLVAARLPVEAAHPLAHAVRTGEPVWVGARSEWAWRDRRFAAGASPLPGQLVLPLLVGGTAAGAVGMHFGDAIPVVDPARRATLLTIAGQCALALDRARLHQAEHDVAETLQRSLLPGDLPVLDRVASAARYLPGAEGVQAGGDWYDLLPVDGHRVAMAVGDVVGQGARAAAVMGQLRSALAGYLLDGHSPAAALDRLDRFASRVTGAAGSTCACLVLDRTTGELTWATAGHLPVLVVGADGARHLDGGAGTVLGAADRPPYAEAAGRIDPGTSVVLYTDGLVERRAEVIDAGLDRLRAVAGRAGDLPPDALVDALLDELVDRGAPADDIALVVVRLVPAPLRLLRRADPSVLRQLRRTVADWAARAGLPAELGEDLEFVVGEAASNAIEHADAREFLVRVDLDGEAGATVAVRDDGRWRPEPADNGHRGHGLRVMRQLADELDLRHGPDGTELRLRLPAAARPARAAPVAPPPPAVGSTALLDGHDGPRIEGDLDHHGAAAVRGPLLRRVAAEPGAVVDLTGVRHLGSAGVGLLAEAAAAAPGLRVRVAPGSAPARILDLAGVVPVLR